MTLGQSPTVSDPSWSLLGHWATPEVSCTLSLVGGVVAQFQAIHGVQEVPWAGEGLGTRISV